MVFTHRCYFHPGISEDGAMNTDYSQGDRDPWMLLWASDFLDSLILYPYDDSDRQPCL